MCRHSYVIVIGGGAALDLVGFAASTAHRGIRLIRFPTTSLSRGDGGWRKERDQFLWKEELGGHLRRTRCGGQRFPLSS